MGVPPIGNCVLRGVSILQRDAKCKYRSENSLLFLNERRLGGKERGSLARTAANAADAEQTQVWSANTKKNQGGHVDQKRNHVAIFRPKLCFSPWGSQCAGLMVGEQGWRISISVIGHLATLPGKAGW
jgi:hypothetical protein